jgi:hypothetical protein
MLLIPNDPDYVEAARSFNHPISIGDELWKHNHSANTFVSSHSLPHGVADLRESHVSLRGEPYEMLSGSPNK